MNVRACAIGALLCSSLCARAEEPQMEGTLGFLLGPRSLDSKQGPSNLTFLGFALEAAPKGSSTRGVFLGSMAEGYRKKSGGKVRYSAMELGVGARFTPPSAEEAPPFRIFLGAGGVIASASATTKVGATTSRVSASGIGGYAEFGGRFRSEKGVELGGSFGYSYMELEMKGAKFNGGGVFAQATLAFAFPRPEPKEAESEPDYYVEPRDHVESTFFQEPRRGSRTAQPAVAVDWSKGVIGEQVSVTLKNGSVVNGVLAKIEDAEVVVRNSSGEKPIPKSDVREFTQFRVTPEDLLIPAPTPAPVEKVEDRTPALPSAPAGPCEITTASGKREARLQEPIVIELKDGGSSLKGVLDAVVDGVVQIRVGSETQRINETEIADFVQY